MTTFKPQGTTGLVIEERLVFEQGSKGRMGYSLPASEVPAVDATALFGAGNVRAELKGFPELAENEVMRHFLRLSQYNYGVDTGFYPLGSCTMKYNPKINEDLARLPGFVNSHPLLPADRVQGNLELYAALECILAEIAGMDAITLQPSAGAHGELTGLMLIRAYHNDLGRPRRKILVPDSAHGTNPASSALCGFDVVEIKSGPDGYLLPETVAAAMDEDVAALMVTNPNTLGIFERHIAEIAAIVHGQGGLMYADGANMNALLASPVPATWASTSSSTTCTKPSAPRTAAADRARARWASRRAWSPSCPCRASANTPRASYGNGIAPKPSARSKASTVTSASSSAPTPTSANWAPRRSVRWPSTPY